MLDDPFAPVTHRNSGVAPYPHAQDVFVRHVTLRDHITTASIIPFASQHQVPRSLLLFLTEQFNIEISNGDTYPFSELMTVEQFTAYWFENFGAVMFFGSFSSCDELSEERDWPKEVLGTFYIKPNYPGRASHISNAGFFVTPPARNRGVGRLLGEAYVNWAPKLGYTYSVFNLVFETNIASCRIWDSLGFKRIGRIKGAGNLRSYPGKFIDAIIFGRDLGLENEDIVTEERFEKIKFYLKHGRYPAGADRSEKSRLRSAATHYKFEPDTDKLMLKDKEVISDAQQQYEIARDVHLQQHGGINKTTAIINEKYHWVRIKETVSQVIRNCAYCKELGKCHNISPDSASRHVSHRSTPKPVMLAQPYSYTTMDSSSIALIEGPKNSRLQIQGLNDQIYTPGHGTISPLVLNHNPSSNDLDSLKCEKCDSNSSVPSESTTYLTLESQISDSGSLTDKERLRNSNLLDSLEIQDQTNPFIDNEIENVSLDSILGVDNKDRG
ncbi:putative histone acetyltransferase spt10 [Erysiphe necator]|uniref:Putative histone acetyltransferase spt10 n=1 Tax=Uncinula necator TaxID=52586 RepID=A0A0B1P883_UNCNE|nr:putative histone acetyltransferase spt10 [Erysiphe necator]